jgi:hypothetical protein
MTKRGGNRIRRCCAGSLDRGGEEKAANLSSGRGVEHFVVVSQTRYRPGGTETVATDTALLFCFASHVAVEISADR